MNMKLTIPFGMSSQTRSISFRANCDSSSPVVKILAAIFVTLTSAWIASHYTANLLLFIPLFVGLTAVLIARRYPLQALLFWAVAWPLLPLHIGIRIISVELSWTRAVSTVVFGGMLLDWVGKRLFEPRVNHGRSSSLPLFILVFISLTTVPTLVVLGSSFRNAIHNAYIVMVRIFLPCFLISNYADDLRSLRKLSFAMLLGGILLFPFEVAEFLSGQNFFSGLNLASFDLGWGVESLQRWASGLVASREGLYRTSTTFASSITLGRYWALLLMLTLWLAQSGWRRGARLRWILLVGLVVNGLIMTVARGPIIAAALSLLVLFFLARSSGVKMTGVWIAILMGIVVLAAMGMMDEFISIFSNLFAEESALTRVNYVSPALWSTLLRIVPSFGVGGPNIGDLLAPYAHPAATNLFVDLMVRNGILGPISFVVLLVAAVGGLLTVIRDSSPDHRSAGIYLLAALVGQIFTFLGTAHFDRGEYITFSLLGLIAALARSAPPTKAEIRS